MLDVLSHALHSVSERVEGWRKYHRAYAELTSLDDRSLADIGLTRSEIPYVLTQHGADKPAELGSSQDSGFRHAA
jgi:uncharacterized protein YjiS (DUF1127 family)